MMKITETDKNHHTVRTGQIYDENHRNGQKSIPLTYKMYK